MTFIRKVKNARPNTGSRCRSGRNGGWLRPGSAWTLLHLCCVGININAGAGTFYRCTDRNVIHDTGRDGTSFCGTSDNGLMQNKLIYDVTDDGMTATANKLTIRNDTILNATAWAIE